MKDSLIVPSRWSAKHKEARQLEDNYRILRQFAREPRTSI